MTKTLPLLPALQDKAAVETPRLGGLSPLFPSATADAGKLRLGGLSPLFAPVADAGRLRMGGLSPLFSRG